MLPKKFKTFLHHFFLIDDSPHKIAGGAALGIFMGIAPGEGVLTTLFFAWLFRLNRISALSGVAATNGWTSFFLLPPAAAIGGFIFHANSTELIQKFPASYSLGWKYFFSKIVFFDLILPIALGLTLIALVIAMVFYFAIYFSLKYKKVFWK